MSINRLRQASGFPVAVVVCATREYRANGVDVLAVVLRPAIDTICEMEREWQTD